MEEQRGAKGQINKQKSELPMEKQGCEEGKREKVFAKVRSFFSDVVEYRPRLSFLALKWVALFLVTLSQLAVWVLSKLPTESPYLPLFRFLHDLNRLTVPLLFVSLISSIFQKKSELPRTVAQYAVYALLFYGVEIFFFVNLIIPVLGEMLKQLIEGYTGIGTALSQEMVDEIIHEVLYALFAQVSNFNVFMDSFLCGLIFLFVFYTPAWADTKKKLLVFRYLALLPALYIVASFVLHGLASFGKLRLDIYLGALLPHKRIAYWFFFGGVLGYLKRTERKTGFKKADISSAVIAALLITVSIIDLALSNVAALSKIGFGKSYTMAVGAPLILLFDVRKAPRYPWLSRLIPVYYAANYGLLWGLFAGGGGLIGFFLMNWLTGL